VSNIINIADRRKKKPPPSPQEVVAFCTDAVMEEWGRFAKSNKLNDFFVSGVGAYAKPFANYLSNPTELALIEEKIGLMPGIWAPGVNGPSQVGWQACFRFGDVLVETPDMMSESYARCCNILIFLKVKREVIAANRPQV
jgi:hypothetical protein